MAPVPWGSPSRRARFPGFGRRIDICVIWSIAVSISWTDRSTAASTAFGFAAFVSSSRTSSMNFWPFSVGCGTSFQTRWNIAS